MKRTISHLLPVAAVAVLAGCEPQGADSGPRQIGIEESRPDEEASAELAKQAMGSKLVGKLVRLSGDAFVPTTLSPAPEYYLAYYSASW